MPAELARIVEVPPFVHDSPPFGVYFTELFKFRQTSSCLHNIIMNKKECGT
ncbi:hypothetical protein D931_00863 [Enterococcus faecium 13.SD.W.09]|nr:hypothetical protein D931_00863 [Enterococcus faecium 13.SD.W.09]